MRLRPLLYSDYYSFLRLFSKTPSTRQNLLSISEPQNPSIDISELHEYLGCPKSAIQNFGKTLVGCGCCKNAFSIPSLPPAAVTEAAATAAVAAAVYCLHTAAVVPRSARKVYIWIVESTAGRKELSFNEKYTTFLIIKLWICG